MRPGLIVWVIDRRYHETRCAYGHVTRAVAGQGRVDLLLAGIELNEWRLVGPWLAAVIVALAYRFRLSRARIQEFLAKWLALGRSAHPARAATRHIARRLRAAPRRRSSENSCLGGRVAQQLGGHLPGVGASRTPVD